MGQRSVARWAAGHRFTGFRRAWSRGDESQRRMIAPQFAEAVRSTDDANAAVDAALEIIRIDPDVSFGKHDYLVASSIAIEARAETPSGFFEPPHHETPSAQIEKRELAARRLAIFLDSATGTTDQRVDAEETLQAIRNSLRGTSLATGGLESFDALVKMPDGTLAELSQRASDTELPLWERAKTRLAIARLHEAAKNNDQALAAYRIALEELGRLYRSCRE